MEKKSIRWHDDVAAAVHREAARLRLSFTWVANDCARRLLIHGDQGRDEEAREIAKSILRKADRKDMNDITWMTDDSTTLARFVLGIPAKGRQTHRTIWWDADFLQEEAS